MKILNLYGGLGGNRKNWDDSFEVTTIEIDAKIAKTYQANFPNDDIIIGDAAVFLLENVEKFDLVWSSPPCQTHSKMMKATRHKTRRYTDMMLYQQIIFLKHFFKGKWIVENVKPFYEPLIEPTKVIGRHFFWSNFDISDFDPPKFKGLITSGTVAKSEELKKWLGINYEGNIYHKKNHCPCQVLRNCVHPLVGEHILNCANL